MTSKTKSQILSDCFTELRISGITVQADNKDIELGLYRLEDFMSELPFNIGYNFESVPQPNTYSGIPAYANFAIASGLALRLAPAYGKMPETLMRQASAAMSMLSNKVCRPGRVSYPTRQPLGMGNRRHHYYHQFMPATISAPNSPSTYQLNIKDQVVNQSVDFSEYLQPLETILTYSLKSSDGVSLSSIVVDGSTISFTVLSSQWGYQQAAFTVTGSLGTTVTRTLDFNVVESTIARGNP